MDLATENTPAYCYSYHVTYDRIKQTNKLPRERYSYTLDLDHRTILEVLEKTAQKHYNGLKEAGNDNLLFQFQQIYS